MLRNGVAYLALFVALGGTSYAAATLPRDSVGNAQLRNASVGNLKLRNHSVSTLKLRNNAVTSAKVRDGSLLMRDFKPGQLKVALKTAKGPAGPPGPSGATKVATRVVSGPVGADARFSATAVCLTGERAVGGGANIVGVAHTWDHVLSSRPGVTATAGGFGAASTLPAAGDIPNAWTAEVYSAVAGRTLNVFVICAAP